MSNLSPENRPPADPSANPPAFNRSKGLTVLMIVVGVILLLPGLCTTIFGFILFDMEGLGEFSDPSVWLIVVPCFAISALGVHMIVRAIRKG